MQRNLPSRPEKMRKSIERDDSAVCIRYLPSSCYPLGEFPKKKNPY